jgi:molybdenum cofactor cytidylyltransferase
VSVTALVLTAGRSRRMGCPKAFLELDHEPLVHRILRVAFAAGVDDAVVVVGAADDPALVSRRAVDGLLRERHLVDPHRVTFAPGAPDEQPIASIRAGLREVAAGAAVLLWPVDQPFATVELVHELLASLGAASHIVRPVVLGRGAHPVLFGATAAAELAGTFADRGAHAVVHRDPSRLIAVGAVDVRLVAALNTPAEAEALGVLRPRQ